MYRTMMQVTAIDLTPAEPVANGAILQFVEGSEEARWCDFDKFEYIIPGVAFGPAMLMGRN